MNKKTFGHLGKKNTGFTRDRELILDFIRLFDSNTLIPKKRQERRREERVNVPKRIFQYKGHEQFLYVNTQGIASHLFIFFKEFARESALDDQND